MQAAGKILILVGGMTLLLGLLLMVSNRIPFLGKLPGDIHVRRESFEFYLPLTTSLLFSLLLSGIGWLIAYFRGR